MTEKKEDLIYERAAKTAREFVDNAEKIHAIIEPLDEKYKEKLLVEFGRELSKDLDKFLRDARKYYEDARGYYERSSVMALIALSVSLTAIIISVVLAFKAEFWF